MRKPTLLASLTFLFAASTLAGQTITSPYSQFGIGELISDSLPSNEGMSDLGVGMPAEGSVNIVNPSFLVDSPFTNFQLGFKADFRSYVSEFVSDGKDQALGLRILGLTIPIFKNLWTTNLSLLPYSAVEYDLVTENPFEGGDVFNSSEGSGGISQVKFSNGVRISERISLGLSAAFLFGTIERAYSTTVRVEDVFDPYVLRRTQETTLANRNILVSMSAGYKHPLGGEDHLNFGVVYGFKNDLDGEGETRWQRLNITGTRLLTDEVAPTGALGESFSIPGNLGIGFSFVRVNNFGVGVDLRFRNWKGDSITEQVGLRDVFHVNAGGYFLPDSNKSASYLKRVVYRFGVGYSQLPYVINDQNINELGLSAGFSFPIYGLSSLETTFRFGLRGTVEEGLIEENYFQTVFSVNINEIWFVKPRYD